MSEADVFSAEVGPYRGRTSESGVVRLRDVVICTTGGADVDGDEFRAHPPAGGPRFRDPSELDPRQTPFRDPGEPVELGRQLRIDRLTKDEADLVMTACTPRGHHFAPVRQFGQRFTFVREVDPSEWNERPYAWDREGVLTDALMLSRLVRDNAYSTEYAARIIDYADRESTIAYTLGGESDHVYRVRRTRDWLDYDEAELLRGLLAAYWSAQSTLPQRVRRALWRTEYSSWVKWGDLILPTLVSGLEALLKTERHQATRQFKVRSTALAAEIDIDEITEDFAEEIYAARSDWVHGASVQLFAKSQLAGEEGGPTDDQQREAFNSIARLQDLLRATVRRCVEEPDFCAVFADDDAIRTRWPV